ncbi:metabolite traffic protein EboE [Cellulosimicrobium protaetiae]|uniref:Metabolite traffic protein EboE n=1 Tax=Cellulosimicrobium protaetiae TaxID=2587808 RepID=A0A6M5ULY6_9MICO|nr:metabolite traffic protein EboE [Cellulosimicrobium protaetiae]
MLSYCTNVHPAEDLDGVVDQLVTYAGPVREAAGLDVLGVGLWMPATLAHRLAASPADRAWLRAVLDEQGLQVHTLNAFPYGGFHADVVKLDVYTPTWADPARLEYTLACAEVLADLLPDGVPGSISTLPLAWREPWSDADDEAATRAFVALGEGLRDLRERTGKVVRVAVEPEPGCVLDTVDDVVSWLAARTGPVGSAGASDEGRIDPEHVGVCLDTCHLAVSFADRRAGTAETVRRITDSGLRVVKVQASAALHVDDPSDPVARSAVGAFAEKRYIHQVRELTATGDVLAADDLPDALGGATAPEPGDAVGHDDAGQDGDAPTATIGRPGALPGEGPWRVHFHVPLHHEPAPPLAATTDVLRDAVDAVRAAPHGDEAHLDVETYTWSVLPEGATTTSLVAGIAAELRWATTHLTPTPAEHDTEDANGPLTTPMSGSTAGHVVLGGQDTTTRRTA